MADRPILFSAPMVRALLDGRKTQTRRIIKPRAHASLFSGEWTDDYVLDPGNESWRQEEIRIKVGDSLYVREHWRVSKDLDATAPRELDRDVRPLWYEAGYLMDTGSQTFFSDKSGADFDASQVRGKHRQAMHMPRWASRLTLTVTDVKVERLQDISEEDAIAEGVSDEFCDYELYGQSQPYRFGYSSLWNLINGEGAWQANPWVVCYSFSVAKGNIDQIARAA